MSWISRIRFITREWLFQHLPSDIEIRDCELKEFEPRLLELLGERFIKISRISPPDLQHDSLTVATISPSHAYNEETYPIRKLGARIQQRMESANLPIAVEALATNLRATIMVHYQAKHVLIQRIDSREVWLFQPSCTWRNFIVWLLTKDTDRLVGQTFIEYRVSVRVALVKGETQ